MNSIYLFSFLRVIKALSEEGHLPAADYP